MSRRMKLVLDMALDESTALVRGAGLSKGTVMGVSVQGKAMSALLFICPRQNVACPSNRRGVFGGNPSSQNTLAQREQV